MTEITFKIRELTSTMNFPINCDEQINGVRGLGTRDGEIPYSRGVRVRISDISKFRVVTEQAGEGLLRIRISSIYY